MSPLRTFLATALCLLVIRSVAAAPMLPFKSRADTPPRKVVVATTVARMEGTIDLRLARIAALVDEAAGRAAERNLGALDLMVLPEYTLVRQGATAADQAVELDGLVAESLARIAAKHRTWLIVPMVLREAGAPVRFSNAAVLFDRAGKVAGLFRKVHPVADEHDVLEGGVSPGRTYPVFDCDFGRLGILICWDMSYDEGWDALAAAGAEIVALPSASPQTLRPSAAALRHRYYVVTSTPRDNASVYDPIGRTIAQATNAPSVLVQRIDLSYAILHWSETLHNGRALADRFGAAVGFDYSPREDTGVFWSNDPKRPIGAMIRELGLREMPGEIDRMDAARRKAQ